MKNVPRWDTLKADGFIIMQLNDSIEAYNKARAVAEVASSMQHNLLRTVIYDAKEQGLGIRETARLLEIPKSTLSRQWYLDPEIKKNMLPFHGSEEAYRMVADYVHSGTWDGHCPWKWIREDNAIHLILVPYGKVVVKPETLGE